ncbi:hypothetical protein OUZ56_020844 [Daphnia magna]|uniref:Uncharacterized protein n=1 Tax=Daphnia magna TaxID=35525 RepID=A0ABQ9ZFN3_9CRUS|nr:hypothetical protein OUZ56_020844 [Daphnia magna]
MLNLSTLTCHAAALPLSYDSYTNILWICIISQYPGANLGPTDRPMAWEPDSVSLGCLPTYPTSNGHVVVWGTRLSCPGNSTVDRLNSCQESNPLLPTFHAEAQPLGHESHNY